MPSTFATARAHPNIAFIKYWGNRNASLRLPSNGSISMNLANLHTTTTVHFDDQLAADELVLNGKMANAEALARVSRLLDMVRTMAGMSLWAKVESTNNFPMGAGIASSASAFAALALSASTAAGMQLNLTQLSRLARRGSGSASRSIPGGFVEWYMGKGDEDSYATALAPASHWDLTDCIAIVSQEHKPTGSTEGHALADTSPLQAARVADTPRRLDACRQAIQERDFERFAEIVEQDSTIMHAVMMTSTPPLFYWSPASLDVQLQVARWRAGGLPVCSTLDAGPNVHVVCPSEHAAETVTRLRLIPGVQDVLVSTPGGEAHILS